MKKERPQMKIEPDDLEYMTELLLLGEDFDVRAWHEVLQRFHIGSRQYSISTNIYSGKGWLARSGSPLEGFRYFVTEKGKRFIASGGTDGTED